MQLRNKYYPYPVIIEGGEYYTDSTFTSSVEQKMEGFNIKLHLTAELKDEKMLSMIKSGELIYVHHIECPQTCYRRAVKTSEPECEILIKDSDVNGTVQICSFAAAEKDIEKYTNESFSPDYRGIKFNIEKGCIMAVGSEYSIRVNKQRDDLKNTASIFSIVKNMDQTADTAAVDLGKQKIIITLPETTYNQYASIQNYADMQPVMHSMIIIPALMYAFSELKEAGNQLYEYEDYRWFRGLRKACGAVNISLDEEGIKNLDIVKVPQLLLNSPLIKAVEFCALGGGVHED